jgi:AcrR family transcriptional regulator
LLGFVSLFVILGTLISRLFDSRPSRRYDKNNTPSVRTVLKVSEDMSIKTAALTRERLLAAAFAVVRVHGAHRLTLDTVAAQANVSKGGLLHHFPTKQALAEALLRALLEAFTARVQHHYEAQPPRAGRWLRAYVLATFDDDQHTLELYPMLTHVATEYQAVLEVLRADWTAWQARLAQDGVPWARATVVRQAADSYWTERMLQAAVLSETQRAALLAELLALTEVS